MFNTDRTWYIFNMSLHWIGRVQTYLQWCLWLTLFLFMLRMCLLNMLQATYFPSLIIMYVLVFHLHNSQKVFTGFDGRESDYVWKYVGYFDGILMLYLVGDSYQCSIFVVTKVNTMWYFCNTSDRMTCLSIITIVTVFHI